MQAPTSLDTFSSQINTIFLVNSVTYFVTGLWGQLYGWNFKLFMFSPIKDQTKSMSGLGQEIGERYFWFGWSVSGHFGSWMRWPLSQGTKSVLRVGGHDTNTGEGHAEKDWVKGILLATDNHVEQKDLCHSSMIQVIMTATLQHESPLSSPLLSLSSCNPSASCCEVHFPPTELPLHT